MENGLKKLKSRIKELQQEKIDIKKNHKELKKMHVSLINSRKEKQSHLQEYEMRALEVQMLKFGKVIDLEKLERMGVNKNADELREKIQKEDQRREKEIEEIERDISDQKEKLTDIIKENTSRMEKLVSMSESKHTLEHSLDKSQSSVVNFEEKKAGERASGVDMDLSFIDPKFHLLDCRVLWSSEEGRIRT